MPTAPINLMPALRRVIAGRAADRPDADLLTAFVADRDPEAFAALVRRHGPMVLGVCRRVGRDHDTADDAFQAVFLVLARRAADVRPRNRVGAWLYGVAYRTALKARAVRARRRTRESQVDAMPEPAAPPAADGWDELKPILDEELARLPDRLRVPVVLCDLEGRPQRAVAGQLGIAPATLAGRLADARRTLAARLTRRGVTLAAPALAALLAERASAGVVNSQLAAGVVRAAEAVAAGGVAAGLVSETALQLCDGVLRMIFLTKLKAAAATAAVLLAVAGAFGPGLVPAVAGDDPGPVPTTTARVADADAVYLDRVCVAIRGTKGTAVEHVYFAADQDAGKRKKVTDWLHAGPVAAEAVPARTVAFSPDGARLVGEHADGTVFLWDVVTSKPARVVAGGDTPWANLTTALDAQPKTGQDRRVEVVVRNDKDAKAPAAGEPVRVKVVVATDDGKGGVKYKVEERLAGTAPKAADGKEPQPQTFQYKFAVPADGKAVPLSRWTQLAVARDTDAAFLRRAVTEARGTPPTALEERYFAADADPKKREKLLDALLADPTSLRRVGDGWKRRMLTPPAAAQPQVVPSTPQGKLFELYRRSDLVTPPQFEVVPLPKGDGQPFLYTQPKTVVRDLLVTPKGDVVKPKAQVPPAPPAPPAAPKTVAPLAAPKAVPAPPVPATVAPLYRTAVRSGDRWSRLVGELIAAGKSDEQMLEALSLAAAARLPTEGERRVALAVLPTAADRAAGWTAVARALAGWTAAPPPTPAAPPALPQSPH